MNAMIVKLEGFALNASNIKSMLDTFLLFSKDPVIKCANVELKKEACVPGIEKDRDQQLILKDAARCRRNLFTSFLVEYLLLVFSSCFTKALDIQFLNKSFSVKLFLSSFSRNALNKQNSHILSP